jgi:hypothetical protein
MVDKKEQGKRNRRKGLLFENLVRKDLEKKGWIVAKWTNNVEFRAPSAGEINEILQLTGSGFGAQRVGKLIPAKRKFNPFNKALSIGVGFPDFICFKKAGLKDDDRYTYDLIGVEAKSNGYLDKEERKKCKWLLDNKIFSKILIARKEGKDILYKEYDNI